VRQNRCKQVVHRSGIKGVDQRMGRSHQFVRARRIRGEEQAGHPDIEWSVSADALTLVSSIRELGDRPQKLQALDHVARWRCDRINEVSTAQFDGCSSAAWACVIPMREEPGLCHFVHEGGCTGTGEHEDEQAASGHQ
jgi:hypothetical protein